MSSTTTVVNGWKIDQYDQYLRIELDGPPGYITLKADDVGFVVDIGPDEGNDSIGNTSAFTQNWSMNDPDA